MAVGTKNISFVGLKSLVRDDQERIKEIIDSKYPFIETEIKRINSLKLHVKPYQVGGKKKYSMHLFIDSPGGLITAEHVSKTAEWDPIASTYILIKKVREQIKNKFRLKTI